MSVRYCVDCNEFGPDPACPLCDRSPATAGVQANGPGMAAAGGGTGPAFPPLAAPEPLAVEHHGPLVLVHDYDDTWTVGCAGPCEAWFVTLAGERHARDFVLANLEGVPGHSCERELAEAAADARRGEMEADELEREVA